VVIGRGAVDVLSRTHLRSSRPISRPCPRERATIDHAVAAPSLPGGPPFTFRARLLTPLDAGATRYETDGALVVDPDGRIVYAGDWAGRPDAAAAAAGADAETSADAETGADARAVDIRPLVLLPGFVDLHVHLPQIASAGLGAGLHLLTWLERHVFPLEREWDDAMAARLTPLVYRAMAAAGTTTFLGFAAIWPDSVDAAFRAAEAHGIRAVIGKVMMDRVTYDDALPRDRILDASLRQSAELCERWHGRDEGRLRYAFTPRFAVSCTEEMLEASASLARATGAYWQTHLSEDVHEIAEVRALFPGASDYLDVYDRAGGLGTRTILAHAIHLSDREVGRLVETGTSIAHCPVSNLFLASGVMPLARYLEAGVRIGLGSDVAAAPELSIVTQMRTGFYAQNALRVATRGGDRGLTPLEWLRAGTLDGARALALDRVTGSLEPGKEADLIAVDPRPTLPPGGEDTDDPESLMSRLIFRERSGMVRGAWVRGRMLEAGT
jgi:guanine deaminase